VGALINEIYISIRGGGGQTKGKMETLMEGPHILLLLVQTVLAAKVMWTTGSALFAMKVGPCTLESGHHVAETSSVKNVLGELCNESWTRSGRISDEVSGGPAGPSSADAGFPSFVQCVAAAVLSPQTLPGKRWGSGSIDSWQPRSSEPRDRR
jgi:hypothetical protein